MTTSMNSKQTIKQTLSSYPRQNNKYFFEKATSIENQSYIHRLLDLLESPIHRPETLKKDGHMKVSEL